jgi:hypothetical protein
MNAINAVPKKPPFVMEVLQAQDVHEVMFDAETGRPIRPVAEQTGVAGPTPHSVPPIPQPRSDGGGNDEPTSSTGGDASDRLDEFPVNFNDLRKK